MVVRRMTPQEKADWLGSGIVLSGFKRPKSSPQPSTSTSEADPQPPTSSSAPVPEDQQILGDRVMKESNEPEIEVYYDSDEFRACELLVEQGTPIEVAISRLIDFHGMAEDESRAYYLAALDQRILGAKDMKKSKELKEMEQKSSSKNEVLMSPKEALNRVLALRARLPLPSSSKSSSKK